MVLMPDKALVKACRSSLTRSLGPSYRFLPAIVLLDSEPVVEVGVADVVMSSPPVVDKNCHRFAEFVRRDGMT